MLHEDIFYLHGVSCYIYNKACVLGRIIHRKLSQQTGGIEKNGSAKYIISFFSCIIVLYVHNNCDNKQAKFIMKIYGIETQCFIHVQSYNIFDAQYSCWSYLQMYLHFSYIKNNQYDMMFSILMCPRMCNSLCFVLLSFFFSFVFGDLAFRLLSKVSCVPSSAICSACILYC